MQCLFSYVTGNDKYPVNKIARKRGGTEGNNG